MININHNTNLLEKKVIIYELETIYLINFSFGNFISKFKY